jgi:hypothetical protein
MEVTRGEISFVSLYHGIHILTHINAPISHGHIEGKQQQQAAASRHRPVTAKERHAR